MSIEINPPHPTGYLLLFRGSDLAKSGLSERAIHEVMGQVNAWFERLAATGKVVSAQPLLEKSVVISGKKGALVTDGPFAEAKEAVGGYVLLSVDTMEEAVELAKANPMHDHGLSTEVRPLASSCPALFEALAQAAVAAVR